MEEGWLDFLSQVWRQRERDRPLALRVAREARAWQQAFQPRAALEVLKAASVLEAHVAWREGRTAHALALLEFVLGGQRGGTLWECRALNVRVGLSQELGDPAYSLAAVHEQLHLSRELGDLDLEASALHDLGVMQNELGLPNGEALLLAAEEKFKASGYLDGLAFTHLNLAHTYTLQGKADEADIHLRCAESLAQEHGLEYVQTVVLAFRAQLLLESDAPQAEQLLRLALQRQRGAGDRPMWEAVEPLALLLMSQARYAEAHELVDGFFTESSGAGLRTIAMKAQLLLAEIHEGEKQPEKALEHYKLYLAEYKHLREEEYEQQALALEMQHHAAQLRQNLVSEQQHTELLSRINLNEEVFENAEQRLGALWLELSTSTEINGGRTPAPGQAQDLIERAARTLARLSGASSVSIERLKDAARTAEMRLDAPHVEQRVWRDASQARTLVRVQQAGQQDALITLEAPKTPERFIEATTRVLQRQLDYAALLQKLDSQHKLLRDLIYAFSHDLRTPLSANLMHTEAALRGAYGPFPDQYLEALQGSKEAMQGLLKLADQMLLVTEYETGGVVGDERVEIDLQDVIRTVLADEKLRLEKKALQVHLDLQRAVVFGRGYDLRRAVQNLLDNAAKFSPPGGSVQLRLRTTATQAVLEVRDQGPGVAPPQQAHLFERFRFSQKASGSGMGLYLTRRILEQHGGQAHYHRDEQGNWSVFTLTLPLQHIEDTLHDQP